MMPFFFLFVFCAIVGIGMVIVFSNMGVYRRWKAYPTLPQYLAQHPECKRSQGIACADCGSGSIRNWGLAVAHDDRRVFICNHCGKHLYRSA